VKDKPAVDADLYTEDSEKNVAQLRGAGHPTIVFGNVTNVGFPGTRLEDWVEVEKIVRSAHERWRSNRQAEADLLKLR
jgi:5' nucleotidase, deoxy (Pyrimidine), cytosolic type C protein (NT5C)